MLAVKVICVALLCIAVNAYPTDESAKDHSKLKWWENGVFYQIYPRSFKDSDGDGIGDIRGIIQKLDYLQELGVDGTWLSPIFKSPMADFGYDIENFYEIDPMFGTMEDLEELFREAKKRNIAIILDFVPNHTSEKCEWFQKSVKREGKYEDYYIWADGKNNNTEPPNNWVSVFYGSAWVFNEERNQWYYHKFVKEQPDLNYRNPAVVEQMLDVLEFWLKKNVSGFRIDALNFLVENKDLYDEPLSNLTTDPNSYDYTLHQYTANMDELFDIVHKIRDTCDKFENENKGAQLVLMAETNVYDDKYLKYFGIGKRKGIQIPFDFMLINEMKRDSSAYDVKNLIDHRLASVPAGTRVNWVLGNHDIPRIASRFGERRIDGILTMIMTLPGVAITYNGEEIGMIDNRTISYEDTVDPPACNRKSTTNWMEFSRDPQRTPMQWDGTKKFAGFMPENSTAKPWLPINTNYKIMNVASQREDPRSTLNFYKHLVQIRKRDTFAYGSFTSQVLNENVFAYVRELKNSDTYWVLINFGNLEQRIDMTTSKLGENISDEFELAAVGTDSCYVQGAKIKATEVVLGKYDVIILKESHS